MPNVLKNALMLLSLMLVATNVAAVDIYDFSSEDNRERFHRLVDELRCPKCQNQNLAGSDSAIAQDLRRELYRMIETGDSDDEIKDFMVSRYGDYVLYRPPVQDNTLLLWWGPPAVFGLGLLIVLILVWRRQRLLRQGVTSQLSADDEARLNELLTRESSVADANDGKPGGNP